MEISLTAAFTGNNKTIIKDFASITEKIEVVFERFDSPGKMNFTCIEKGEINIPEGSAVTLTVDGLKMFKGYAKTIKRERYGVTTYTCYDQIRYLKSNESYTFEAMRLDQIITEIAKDFQLNIGTLDPAAYKFPCLIKEDVNCMDIIYEALAESIVQDGKIYVFYDNAGELTLTEAENLFVNVLIGNASLLTDFSYKRDIDSNTYNRIKLVRPNQETGKADVYVSEDTETIKQWGVLQYYAQVDENMNAAQIEQMCQQYLKYYNRVLQTLTIECMGVKEVRAGSIIPVRIEDVLPVTRLLLVEKVTHTFEGSAHTMSIEVKDFSQLGGIEIV